MDDKQSLPKIDRARTIGLLFLLAFFAYGIGRYLCDSTQTTEKFVGAALVIANSIMVALIGVFLSKTLAVYDKKTSKIYLSARIVEAIALASIAIQVFVNSGISKDFGYFVGMLVLGLGSIPMCIALYKHRIAPAWLAMWGAVGYAIFAFGFLMELLGKQWSMYLLGLGGLWEIVFAIWLIAKASKR
ncbi:MAG: hypothetical protein RL660_14 [Bacteroidota bacterium]|jgi:hypothetical protein